MFTTIFIWLLSSFSTTSTLEPYTLSGEAQGTTYHITYYDALRSISEENIDSILSLIDHSLSIYNKTSLISQFNQNTRGVPADSLMRRVIADAYQISKNTGGLFDITVLPLLEAYGFGADSVSNVDPAEAFRWVGYRNVWIQNDSLLKSDRRIRIDVNGIAQGMSVDILAEYFDSRGINNYLIELGGEVRVKGLHQPGGRKMRVGIESPSEDGYTKIVELTSGALTTSGNYRKYRVSQGKKLSHIIDPVLGHPVENEMISVTVYAPDATTADGYDNAFMVMGVSGTQKFLSVHPEMAAYIIYKDGDEVKDLTIGNFPPEVK